MLRKFICTFIAALMLLTAIPGAYAEGSFMPVREFEGVRYEGRSSSSLTTVLLIGYDHNDGGSLDAVQEGYIQGGQSDFLLVLAIDHDAKTIRRLQINRDTMTPIIFINREGVNLGKYRMQICLSHAYGDTQEVNNSNTIWAVENLLGIADANDGAQIDWYMSMDYSAIAKLNDLLGGVTVPIEDDFSQIDPSMVMGTTMKLTGQQAHWYCRGRHHVADQTNVNRMKRQRIYMNAAAKQLKERLIADPDFAMELLNGMGIVFDRSTQLEDAFGFTTSDYNGTPVTDTADHYLMTNESMSSIAQMMLRAVDYELYETEFFEGVNQIGANGYMEFVPEENAGIKWALDALYRPLQ